MKILIFIGVLCLVQASPAQNAKSGTIAGSVFNEATKEPIIGASVQVVGTTIGAATDENGSFSISNVPIGTYQVRASAIGFTPHTHTDIIVAAGKQTQTNIGLQETTLQFEGVTITTEYFQKSPDAPVSVQTLDAEEIRRLPGGLEDVVRAVSILPGVAQAEPGRNDLIVRGGAPSENLYVVDNIEVSNINHFGTQGSSGGPISFINLDYVDETIFKTGGFGVRYGDKLSSVLSIKLKNGRTDRIGGKATLSSSQFGFNLDGPIHDNGTFIFSARRSYLDFIFKAAGFGFVPEYWDFLFKADYKLSSSDNISLLGVGALDRVKLFNDTEQKRYDNSRLLDNDQNQVLSGVTWRHLLSRGYSTVTVSNTYNDYRFQQNDSLLNPVFQTNSKEIVSSIKGDFVYQLLDDVEGSAGTSVSFDKLSSTIFLPSFVTPFGQAISVNAHPDTTGIRSSGYIQFSGWIYDHIRLTAGGRIDYSSHIEKSIAFSPRIAISYSFSPSLSLNGSVGTYKQSPSLIWISANPVNRNLKFITVNQYIAGIEYLPLVDVKVSLEVYDKNYTDYPASTTRPYLVLANTGAGFGGSEDGFSSFGLDPLVSNGTGKVNGAELFIQKKLSTIPWYGLLSISYSKALFTALDGIERPGSYDQRWIISAGGGYIVNQLWEISGKFRFATGRPYTPFNADGSQNSSEYNSRRVRANHSLDLRVDRRWNFDGWNLITYLDIQNVYNRKALSMPRFDARTNSVVQSQSIGFLPSIGISAEF